MNLCISSTGKESGSQVDSSFGRAPYFLIIDTDTMRVKAVQNPAAITGQGAGIAAAQTATDQGADAVLTGYVGPNAFNALRAAGIRVFEGLAENETVRDALARFARGEYKETTSLAAEPGCGGQGKGQGGGRGRGRAGCRRQ
ncbi:MAG: NifB/NifX family molybdenum-iron cluster-binding protein [Desulfobulbaceae bacterium]